MRRVGISLALVLVALAACGGGNQAPAGRKRPNVVTAFYPLEFVAERVGGHNARISSLTPAGVEPHDLELTSGQVISVIDSDALIYLGRGFQPSLERLLPQVKGKKLDALAGQELIKIAGAAAGTSNAKGGDPAGSIDQHIWLDPVRMVKVTNAVAAALAQVDHAKAAAYRANAKRLIQDLNTLDDDFQTGLALCARREIVTSHQAFGYLAQRYNLRQVGIAGVDPESEPSAKALASVRDFVKQNKVTTIFFERLLPPNLAQTVARETGTTTAVLDPIESPPEQGDYLSAMRTNLAGLRTALSCR
jgi:zinc transport system substrate-binding protein